MSDFTNELRRHADDQPHSRDHRLIEKNIILLKQAAFVIDRLEKLLDITRIMVSLEVVKVFEELEIENKVKTFPGNRNPYGADDPAETDGT